MITKGPDFTTGACPEFTEMAWGRMAGTTIWCSKPEGHEGSHYWWVEWNTPKSPKPHW